MGFSRNCCVFALFTFRVKITRNISSSFSLCRASSGVVFILVRRLRSLRGAALNVCVVLELRRNIPSPASAVNNGVHRTWHRLTAFFINYHKRSELWYYICWFADGDYASFFFLKPLAKFEWFIERGKSFSNFTQELSWCVELQRECNLNIHFYARRLLYFVWTPVKNSFTYTVYTDNFNI